MQPRFPPTDAARKLKSILYILIPVHLVLAIVTSFATSQILLQDLLLCLILWCGASKQDFCMLIIYMIFCGYSFVNSVSAIGLLIQTASYHKSSNLNVFGIIMVCAMVIFYPIAIFFCFRAYKEFKGIAYDNGA
jgi:hypothetical protein